MHPQLAYDIAFRSETTTIELASLKASYTLGIAIVARLQFSAEVLGICRIPSDTVTHF